jgi:hypothetical protein
MYAESLKFEHYLLDAYDRNYDRNIEGRSLVVFGFLGRLPKGVEAELAPDG